MKTNETKPDDMTDVQWEKYLKLLNQVDPDLKETRNHEHKARLECHKVFLKRYVMGQISLR
jgi:hypothetical protein